MTITFRVDGLPAGQGNHRTNQHGATYETSKNHKPWRDSVIWHASTARMVTAPKVAETLTGPVMVVLTFRFPRPKSHYGTGKNADKLKADAPDFKTSAPDIDKLIRSVLDALAIAGVYKSDAQVASVHATKLYTNNHLYRDVGIDGTPPGLLVTVGPA